MNDRTNHYQKNVDFDHHQTILPPATIGILGGGQLGRMMALEARKMGYRIVTLDPTPDSPCAQVADRQIQAAFDSIDGARTIAQHADVMTYEFENIGANIADHLEKESTLPQGYSLLYTTQNRLREKQAIEAAGGGVAPYRSVTSSEELQEAIEHFHLPLVLKTTEGGYDGKGQWVLRDEAQVRQVKAMIVQEQGQPSKHGAKWIVEKLIPFQKELSVIVARNRRGEVRAFPASENIHQENILHLSIVPARIESEVQHKAEQLAIQLAEHFQLVGVLAIELFVEEDGRLYVNELAPRPHNSGHYTQQGCSTSQFEQHVRAICNLPLGNPTLLQPTVMVNILGQHVQSVLDQLPQMEPSMKVHLYGKKEAKPKRKMGHVNVLADTVEEGLTKIKALQIWNMEESK